MAPPPVNRPAWARRLTVVASVVAAAVVVAVLLLVIGGPPGRARKAAPSPATAGAPATHSDGRGRSQSNRPHPGNGRRRTPPAPMRCHGGWTLIAKTRGATPRYDRPGGSPDGTIPARWYGGVSTLPVIRQKAGWLKVRLATRPDGSTAWVRRADVVIESTPYRITIDRATRHLALYRLCQQIIDAPAGIGTAQDPTPTGHYFVAFLEASPSAGYGPFIMVTSAHSEVIQNWEGSGDAVIGIHGPLGANARIGNTGAYISHGCIRLSIPNLLRLRDVPAGSPIDIFN